ncbi:GyrI-like domain-containing protein [Phenylobacterium sp.]|uniref:AraC family transcriptional regulator n=1 Tax=Phenylobacterium sp. TaxID=1871053 RepID=UPI002737BC33|nr:AraC family transcriptional regulator [Phenylobacterium sp.]MDP3868082.1 AraC family transcriptional regulator [Phenylobacterium sp.]
MNRAVTRESYARRLQRVIEHIWTRLDAPLDLEALAQVACLSPYHFHRIYRAMIGETVAETVSRLRLQRASMELARGQDPIRAIAVRAGYTSASAFTRAFRATYDQTPADFRAARRRNSGADPMPVEIQDRPPMRIATVPHRGPPPQIGQAFDRLMAWAGPKGVVMPPAVGVAVYLDDMSVVPPADQRALAGITVGPEVAGDETVTIHEVPAGRYAVLLYKGPYAQIGKGYEELFGWLPSSGEEPADAPCVEVNLNDPRKTAPADLLTELCLPLKS